MAEKSNTPLTPMEQNPRGRGGDLSPVQQDILRRVMNGESVRAICRDDDMPCTSTVMNWLASDPDFRTAYSLAKQLLAETLAEEILEISDDTSGDWIECENGKELDREHVQRSKLRVDSRKWLAGKLAPKRYGDASTLKVGGFDSGRESANPIEIATRMAAIAAAIKKKGK